MYFMKHDMGMNKFRSACECSSWFCNWERVMSRVLIRIGNACNTDFCIVI